MPSLFLLLLCLTPITARPAEPTPPFTALLIAGDDSLPVFENATSAFRAQLILRHLATPSFIRSLAAAGPDYAKRPAVAAAIAAMHPAPGQGCLVFATSHGDRNRGLYLAADDSDLTPAALNTALIQGCGSAPTIVIVSACFSGQFTRGAMRAPNRIILTAARPDRTSFGCQAGRQYTVYDRCLLDAFPAATAWPALFTRIRACVAAEEKREDATPSDPQAFFGAAVQTALPAPAK